MLQVYIKGIAAPKGSKTLYGTRMVESSKKLPAWMQQAKTVFAEAALTNPQTPFTGALKAEIVFIMERPKSVNRITYTTKPDLDKLCRAIFDAAEQAGLFITGDQQIAELQAKKVYQSEGLPPGALVTITKL
jgi:Holliday junction resolvase RusA-like endonuclease